jgi:hypothetical protein
VDGALVGVGSFKRGEKEGKFYKARNFFPFNQAMNILGGQESCNIPAL